MLKINANSVVGLIGVYIISVDTLFMPKVKEIVFLIIFGILLILMFKKHQYKLHHIVVIHALILFSTFFFIIDWDIAKNEFALFFYRKFQYIFVMISPLIIYSYTKNKEIIKYINVTMLTIMLFLIFNVVTNLGSLSPGKFKGILSSRPGAGVLALLPLLYFLYLRQWNIYKDLNISDKRINFYLGVALVIALIYVTYTGSKTAGFGIVIIFGVLLIANLDLDPKKIFIVFMGLLLLYMFLPAKYFSDLTKFREGTEISSSIQRFIEWNVAIDVIKDNWPLGVGWKKYPDMINSVWIAYGKVLFPFIKWKYCLNIGGDSSSQNVLIDYIAIFGMLGFFYDLFLFYVLFRVYKIEGIRSYILIFLVIILITNNFNFGNGYEPIFWFLVGMVLLKDRIEKEKIGYNKIKLLKRESENR